MRLAEKVAIVTGSGQGIGHAIAVAYAAEGASVVVAEIKTSRMDRTVGEIRQAGGSVIGISVDTGKRDDVLRMVADTVHHFGRVDVLVNNAQGFGPRVPLEQLQDEQFDRVFASGAKGTLWSMQAVFPSMRRHGGRIINFVSLAAERGDPGLADYNAAKGAILALTRTAAREWGQYGILVNCIAPGALTKRSKDFAARDPEGFAKMMDGRPIARLGDPLEDIAPIAVFLASDDARFLTGHTIYADGGAHISVA